MQLYLDKLQNHLQGKLAPAYLLAGDEPLLLREAADAIRSAAREAGFANVETTTQDSGFEWQSWLSSGAEMSLFGDRRLQVLRLATAAIGNEGSRALCDYLASPDPDTLLLVTAPRVNGKPKWVSAFVKSGVYVPIYPVDVQDLPRWLAERAARQGLQLQREAATLLAERVEGNLMAAAQEIEKLSLLYASGDDVKRLAIGVEQVADAVGNSARFSSFDMLSHALAGESLAAARALQHLQSAGSEPVEFLGAIAYELRNLGTLLQYKRSNRLEEGVRSLRMPPAKRAIYQRALPRLDEADIERCTLLASEADLLGKSGQAAAAFTAIEMILLRLGGNALPAENALLSART